MSDRILVVDDDESNRVTLERILRREGLDVVHAASGRDALVILREQPVDLVLTDLKMPGMTGIDLLKATRMVEPDVEVVVMTAYGTVETAVEAMKEGAYDFVSKPLRRMELVTCVRKALEKRRLSVENRHLRERLAAVGEGEMIGRSQVMRALLDEVEQVAPSDATVLFTGESGTGKSRLARLLHRMSRRKAGRLVTVNCAAIPESLLESELFGHEKGAFTGAIRQHHGKFEQADGGTILLDEIGEIDPYMQVKLLRVLENGELQRVGGTETLMVDVRVLASTNKDLRAEARAGRFREDLFYRLNVVALAVPSLAERRDDIPLLIDHFLHVYSEKNRRDVPRLGPGVLERLMRYPWPGNVRQLEHAVERAVILCRDGEITDLRLPDETPETPADGGQPVLPPEGTKLQDWLLEFERRVLVEALKANGGVQAQAARQLGVSRSNLNYRIHRLGIRLADIDFE